MDGRSVSFRTSDGLTLEGVFHLPVGQPPFAGVVVCHPHPQFGGDMDNNVVHAVCEAAASVGVATLRFNFRGVGASEGAYDGGRGEQLDALAALDCLCGLPEVDSGRVGLAGYSFGATVALRAAAADDRPAAVVAVSMPTAGTRAESLPSDRSVLFVSGDRDEFSDPEELRRLAATSPSGGMEVVIVPGVDHFWWGAEDRLKEIVAGYLGRTFTN